MAQKTNDEAIAEIWEMFHETARRFQETDLQFKETALQFKETDRRFKETDRKFKETDALLEREFRRLEGTLGIQWGRLIEALVKPGALKLFQEWGLPVEYIAQRLYHRRNGSSMEIDLLLENDTDAVVVETKSTLRVRDVDDFLDDLAKFVDYFPRYSNHNIYGALSCLEVLEDADKYAYRRGLFVITVTGNDLVEIRNDQKFRPRNFKPAGLD